MKEDCKCKGNCKCKREISYYLVFIPYENLDDSIQMTNENIIEAYPSIESSTIEGLFESLVLNINEDWIDTENNLLKYIVL
jgi:hypothetical protein